MRSGISSLNLFYSPHLLCLILSYEYAFILTTKCNLTHSHYRGSHTEDAGSNNNLADEGSEDVEMMDENIAALVLTSLSCSPQSPQYHVNDFKGTVFDISQDFAIFCFCYKKNFIIQGKKKKYYKLQLEIRKGNAMAIL